MQSCIPSFRSEKKLQCPLNAIRISTIARMSSTILLGSTVYLCVEQYPNLGTWETSAVFRRHDPDLRRIQDTGLSFRNHQPQ